MCVAEGETPKASCERLMWVKRWMDFTLKTSTWRFRLPMVACGLTESSSHFNLGGRDPGPGICLTPGIHWIPAQGSSADSLATNCYFTSPPRTPQGRDCCHRLWPAWCLGVPDGCHIRPRLRSCPLWSTMKPQVKSCSARLVSTPKLFLKSRAGGEIRGLSLGLGRFLDSTLMPSVFCVKWNTSPHLGRRTVRQFFFSSFSWFLSSRRWTSGWTDWQIGQ